MAIFVVQQVALPFSAFIRMYCHGQTISSAISSTVLTLPWLRDGTPRDTHVLMDLSCHTRFPI